MLMINDVYFAYQKEEYILKGVDLNLTGGKIYVLLGKNGAGKTTLLKCLANIYDINSGSIKRNVEPIFIEDNPKLYFYLTGREYVDLILTLNDGKNKDILDNLVKELGMEQELDKTIIDYSLGMKHKMALMSAMALDYQLFLIDEPLTALDPETSRFMIDYFKQMRRTGKSLLISTHMMHVAYQLADEILILSNGKLRKIINSFKDFEEFENHVINELKMTL